MSEQELSNPNIAVKTLKNTCKSSQTSTKYYSVTMRFGQKLTWHILNLIAEVLGLHLVYHWCHLCHLGSRSPKYSLWWLHQDMLVFSQIRQF